MAPLSGHSVRVRAIHDLLAFDHRFGVRDASGRWKSNRMPLRYREHVPDIDV